MSKITSKFQVTLPKAIADKYGIGPGDEIEWIAAGEVIRVIPPGQKLPQNKRETQLRLFDQATERHRARASAKKIGQSRDRGWRREDLYRRGRSH